MTGFVDYRLKSASEIIPPVFRPLKGRPFWGRKLEAKKGQYGHKGNKVVTKPENDNMSFSEYPEAIGG